MIHREVLSLRSWQDSGKLQSSFFLINKEKEGLPTEQNLKDAN